MSSSVNTRVLAGAVATWLIPLVVSFGLYNPETGVYIPNYWGFKLIMAGLAATVCFVTYRWIAKQQPLATVVPAVYLAVNSVLDLILLVAMFQMPFQNWLMTIFSIYFVVFFAIWLLMRGAAVRS